MPEIPQEKDLQGITGNFRKNRHKMANLPPHAPNKSATYPLSAPQNSLKSYQGIRVGNLLPLRGYAQRSERIIIE
jgi:hypothetical protein